MHYYLNSCSNFKSKEMNMCICLCFYFLCPCFGFWSKLLWHSFYLSFAIPLLLLLSWHRNGSRLLLCLFTNDFGVHFKPCFAPLASGIRKKKHQDSQLVKGKPGIRQGLGANLVQRRSKYTLTFNVSRNVGEAKWTSFPFPNFTAGCNIKIVDKGGWSVVLVTWCYIYL